MPIPETFAGLKAQGGVMVYLPRHRARAEYSLAKLREVGFANIELTEGVDAHTADARRIAATEGWSFDPMSSQARSAVRSRSFDCGGESSTRVSRTY